MHQLSCSACKESPRVHYPQHTDRQGCLCWLRKGRQALSPKNAAAFSGVPQSMFTELVCLRTAVCCGFGQRGNGFLEVVFAEGAAVVHDHKEAVAARGEYKVLQRRRPVVRVHHVAGRPAQTPLKIALCSR